MKRPLHFLGALAVVVLLASPAPCRAELLLFLRGDSLWSADTSGSRQRELAAFEEPLSAALSPDGGLAAVTAGRVEASGLAHLYLLPLESTGGASAPAGLRRLVLPGVSGVSSPSFAPDGRSLLLVAALDLRQESSDGLTFATMSVIRADLDGTLEQVLLRAEDSLLDAGYVYSSPALSPDQALFAVQHSGSDVSGGFSVHRLDSGEEVFSFPLSAEDYRPFWAPQFLPDGQRILCWSPAVNQGEENGVFLVDMTDGSLRSLARGSRPTLVEDGRTVIFERCDSAWSDTGCGLWRLELDTGAKPRLIIEDAHTPAGAWPR